MVGSVGAYFVPRWEGGKAKGTSTGLINMFIYVSGSRSVVALFVFVSVQRVAVWCDKRASNAL